jgi:hypothetical protein
MAKQKEKEVKLSTKMVKMEHENEKWHRACPKKLDISSWTAFLEKRLFPT